MKAVFWIGLPSMAAFAVLSNVAFAGDVASGKGLEAALSKCFVPPPKSEGDRLTLRFSLSRGGAVIGRPRVSFSEIAGDAGHRKAFTNAAFSALATCTPVALAPVLGRAIAGQPIAVTFDRSGLHLRFQDS